MGGGVSRAPPHLDVLEFKHVSLDKGAAYLLIGPGDEELVVVVSLIGRGGEEREENRRGEGGRGGTISWTDEYFLITFSVSPVEK